MLILPIKRKWFDMILSGEKKEEYREIKPYWTTRFKRVFPFNFIGRPIYGYEREVIFKNGYRKDAPSFVAKCTLSVGTGNEELTVQEIISGEKKEREI